MEAQLLAVVVEGRVELVGPMEPAAIDNHHDLFAGFPKDVHDLMKVLAEFLGIKMGDDLIEDARGPILDRADDTEQHAAGDPTPGAMAEPRLAFEGLFAFDLTLAQRAYGEAWAQRCAPPAHPRQCKAPQDRFVFVQ